MVGISQSAETDSSHGYSSSWPDLVVPDETLPDFLLTRADELGDHPAVMDVASGQSLTYRQLAVAVQRVAAGLAAHGLRKGDVFAILSPNCRGWLVGAYGAMTAGGVVSRLNPQYTVDELVAQLADFRARFLLTAAPLLPTARAAVERADVGTRLIVFGEGAADAVAFDELLSCRDPLPQVDIDPATDLALLPYSSGTTGLAKGVMLTHRACVANALQTLAAFPVSPADRMLAVAPFFHAVGFGVIANSALRAGATIVTLPRFAIETLLPPPFRERRRRHPTSPCGKTLRRLPRDGS